MNDDRDDANQRPLWFHWLVNAAFALVVTLPFEFDWEVVPFAVVVAVLLTPLTRRWERRARGHA